VCCSVLQSNADTEIADCVARVMWGVLQCDAVCCSVLQCVADPVILKVVRLELCGSCCKVVVVCCNVLQCVAAKCRSCDMTHSHA